MPPQASPCPSFTPSANAVAAGASALPASTAAAAGLSASYAMCTATTCSAAASPAGAACPAGAARPAGAACPAGAAGASAPCTAAARDSAAGRAAGLWTARCSYATTTAAWTATAQPHDACPAPHSAATVSSAEHWQTCLAVNAHASLPARHL